MKIVFWLLKIIFYCIMFSLTSSFKYQLPTKTKLKNFNQQEIKVIEPVKTEPKETYSVIFLTGGNNIIIGDIYNNFLNTLASFRFSINLIPPNFNKFEDLLKDLNKEYKGVVLLQHSSSTILSVKISNLDKKVKKLVFLDPVDNRIFFKEYRKLNNKIDLPNANRVLFLKAHKAYKWSLKPVAVPFIPFLSLNPDSFNFTKKCKVTTIEADNFGHTDLLDKTWSDFMHNSRVALGSDNRDSQVLLNYHKWLSKIIHYFCYGNTKKITNFLENEELEYSIKNHQ